MSLQPKGLPEIPAQTVAVAQEAFSQGTLAMRVRDRLGEVFADEPFAGAFGRRGAPGLSPTVLSLVTVLQFTEHLTDRQAAAMAVRAIDWKYAIGAELTDTGFDATVLSRFRARLAEHGMERVVFDRLLEVGQNQGLIGAGGKQCTDSTHVIGAVRDLNWTELAGESVRAALEALAAAAAGWLADAVDIPEFAQRYAERVNGWTMPWSKSKRDRLAVVFGHDALALCRAIWSPGAPRWLRADLIQNATRHHRGHPGPPRPLTAGQGRRRVLEERLEGPPGQLPPGPYQHRLVPRPAARPRHHRRPVRPHRLPRLPCPGQAHHLGAGHPHPQPLPEGTPRDPGRCLGRAGHEDMEDQVHTPRRYRGHHQPGPRRHRPPPGPLPRTARGPPPTDLLRHRRQRHPARRPLEPQPTILHAPDQQIPRPATNSQPEPRKV